MFDGVSIHTSIYYIMEYYWKLTILTFNFIFRALNNAVCFQHNYIYLRKINCKINEKFGVLLTHFMKITHFVNLNN
jgi:hypothetical protein